MNELAELLTQCEYVYANGSHKTVENFKFFVTSVKEIIETKEFQNALHGKPLVFHSHKYH
jgi:thermostable 8-oxoguanine DNA glycosylase